MRLLFLLLLSPYLLPSDAFSQARTIRIGHICDLSGKAAFWGEQSSFGSRLAAEELKQAGHDIEIIYGDSKMDSKTAISEAQQMLHLKKVDAVINEFTPTSIAASPIVARAKKLYIYMAPIVSILESNPYAFKSFLDYQDGCKNIAQSWKSQGITRIANLKLNTEFGELCLAGAKSVFPELQVTDYNSGEDLRTSILLMKKQGIEAFIQTAYEIDMLSRLQTMDEIDFHVPVGVPEPLVSDLVIEKQKYNLDDTVVFGYPKISAEFIELVKRKNPKRQMINIEAAALAYTHVKQIVAAIEACPINSINCQTEKLAKSAPDKTISFDGWKNRQAQFNYTLKTWSEGQFRSVQKAR